MHNHGMLAVGSHPTWRVVRGGSHSYIPRLIAPLGEDVHLGVDLRSVTRDAGGVTLRFADRPAQRADEVVFACGGDRVLPLLADASDIERDVLAAFTTTANDVWLHTDARLLPSAARARAAWNYRLGAAADAAPTVTYDLNRLQRIPGPTTYCVTLNPAVPIAPETVIGRYTYHHPRYSLESVRAQSRWREVSGVRHTHFCGAYWRYGFHEDGLVSAIRVARDLGVEW
jgi:predicted NAD/FAD-binding protein